MLITPKHGFAFVWSGFRTRSLGRGGSLGAAAARARFVVFFPATMVVVNGICCSVVVVNNLSLQQLLLYSTFISISGLLGPRGSSPHLSTSTARSEEAGSFSDSAGNPRRFVLATAQQHARRPLRQSPRLHTRHKTPPTHHPPTPPPPMRPGCTLSILRLHHSLA